MTRYCEYFVIDIYVVKDMIFVLSPLLRAALGKSDKSLKQISPVLNTGESDLFTMTHYWIFSLQFIYGNVCLGFALLSL